MQQWKQAIVSIGKKKKNPTYCSATTKNQFISFFSRFGEWSSMITALQYQSFLIYLAIKNQSNIIVWEHGVLPQSLNHSWTPQSNQPLLSKTRSRAAPQGLCFSLHQPQLRILILLTDVLCRDYFLCKMAKWKGREQRIKWSLHKTFMWPGNCEQSLTTRLWGAIWGPRQLLTFLHTVCSNVPHVASENYGSKTYTNVNSRLFQFPIDMTEKFMKFNELKALRSMFTTH